MSYSIVLLSLFYFLETIWIFKVLDNFSNCKLLVFQIVKLKKNLIYKIVKFLKFVNVSNLKHSNIWSFSNLVNHSNLGKYPIFQIWNYWEWGLEFQRANMRIDGITNGAEYRMDEQNQNLPIFGVKFWFSKLKKKFQQFPKFYNSENHRDFHYRQTRKIIKFMRLLNFKNYQIFKVWQFVKLSKFQEFRFWW